MKHLIFISLILFFATSCKKETTVVIQAQDYNTGDGSAYAGQEYAVAETWKLYSNQHRNMLYDLTLNDYDIILVRFNIH